MPAAQSDYLARFSNVPDWRQALSRVHLKTLHSAADTLSRDASPAPAPQNVQANDQWRVRTMNQLRVITANMEPKPSFTASTNAKMSNQQWRIDYATDHSLTPAQIEQNRLLLLADAKRREFATEFHKKPQPVLGLAPNFVA